MLFRHTVLHFENGLRNILNFIYCEISFYLNITYNDLFVRRKRSINKNKRFKKFLNIVSLPSLFISDLLYHELHIDRCEEFECPKKWISAVVLFCNHSLMANTPLYF